MKRTFEFHDDKSSKFWNIDTVGAQFTVTFGKIGTGGQSQTKTFADEAACTKEANKLIAEKIKKGYVEQGEEPVDQSACTQECRIEPVEKTVAQNSVTSEKKPVIEKKVSPPGEQTKVVIDAIIAEIERQEAAIRKVWDEEIEYEKGDWLRPGWAYGIHFSWTCMRPQDNYAGINETTCFFEWRGVHISHQVEMDNPAQANLDFLTTAIMDEEIVPVLQAHIQKKVNDESWGGVYGANFQLVITLEANREPLPSDPPHMQGQIWEQRDIEAKSATRLEKELQMIHDFIADKKYETENLKKISESLGTVCYRAARDLYDKLGAETLTAFYKRVLERTIDRNPDDFADIVYGFTGAARALIQPEDKRQPDEAMLHLACQLCMWVLVHGTDKYEKDHGREALNLAGQSGSKEARDILKFGTGQIAPEIMQYRDRLVTCAANDIEKIIDLKLKEESADAYRAMIEYIIRLIKADFPNEYTIKFNSKDKNFIPGLPKTRNQQFWNNAARYPALWSLMKDYVRAILDPFDYYGDATNEEAIPVGGWAVFALGLASEENNDIVEEFMNQNDSEHSITPSCFVMEWLEKYGLTPQNAGTVVACALGMNELGAGTKIKGLDHSDALTALIATMQKRERGSYEAEQVAETLWGSMDKLKKAIKTAPSDVKTQLETLLTMCEAAENESSE